MNIIKTLGLLSLTAIITLVLYINFSTVSTTYVCSEQAGTKVPTQVFITYEKYHPWASIWNNSNGKITYEIPLKEKGSFSHIIQDNQNLYIYKNHQTVLDGSYSNNSLILNTKNKTVKAQCIALNSFCDNNLTH